ncbi:P-loop containing nucleoside triphosphate hydrolase protein [Lyophyllum atratum]|nr:P-loop containing nucleoside triphosphate hydrolase protein [Lyophyllum atratum]
MSSTPPTLIEGPTTVPNVLIFGETGAGKSSLINLIAGQVVASVSTSAQGETYESTPHSFTIPGTTQAVQLWDTPGLNEGEHGTIPALQAMKNLEHLVSKMRQGVSLLVYCVRGPRFRDGWKTNYNLIVKGFCQGKVPVVLIVTGLENESPSMEDWWTRNEKVFRE